MEISQLLKEADKLDAKANTANSEAFYLRHEYLRAKGWIIHGEMVGPTMSYFYSKGDFIGICEWDALDCEENECCNGG